MVSSEQLCPCYKEYQEFQKMVELKDSGLVIYCHRPHKEDIRHGKAVESAVNTSSDIFILHNKEDETTTTSELFSELDHSLKEISIIRRSIRKKNINCPRCRKTFEHAQKLMQDVKSIDRKIVMGICDHCRKKVKTIKKPFCACEEIVKKFISLKGEQKEDIKKCVKICLSKMERLKNDIWLNKPKHVKSRAYSELQINRGLNSSASRQFYSEKHKSDINLNPEITETDLKEGNIKQAVAFFQPSEHEATTFDHTPHESEQINTMIPSTSLVDSDTTFVETSVGVKELPRTSLKDRKQEEVFEDIPSMDAKEALKRRHDLTLRQMRIEKHSGVPYPVSKRPVIYETPKVAPWEQKEPATFKYHVESEMDTKIPKPTKTKHDLGHRSTRDVDYVSNRLLKFGSARPSPRNLQDSYSEQRKVDKYHYDKIKQEVHDSEQGPKKVKKLEDCYLFNDEKFKLQRSVDKISHKSKQLEHQVVQSKSRPIETVENVLKPRFSFFFPKVKENKENEINLNVSSSQLIKDNQERFRLQAARLKKRQEEQLQQKLEQDQNKKLQTEYKNKYAQDQKRLTERDKSKDGLSDKTNKDVMGKYKPKGGDNKGAEKGEESSQREKEAELQKMLAEHLKEKAKALKKKKELELDAQKAKEAERKAKLAELNMSKNKILKGSAKSVRSQTKQAETKIRPCDIDPELLKTHNRHRLKSGHTSSFCPLCLNSELELEVLALVNKRNLTRDKLSDIIIGENIFKHKPRLEKTKEPQGVPIFFQKKFRVESDHQPIKEQVQTILKETKTVQKQSRSLATVLSKKDTKEIEMEPGKGIIRYALSDRTFIDKGWTMLPTEKVLRKMNVYRMHPAQPEFDWFEHNKNKRLMTYDTGERLAEFDDNGRGRWYYRSGRLALDYYDAEETNAQQRFVVYSSGEPDERGRTHPITILATFDYLGNGIVFDHAGNIRLNYNQSEGVVLDRAIGPVSHWQWHSLNDPPVLQKVMIDTQMAHKDPDILKLGSANDTDVTRPDNEEMLTIEYKNFIKEKSKKLSQKFKPFQIKMKALKINEHFSLKVLDQATVYLIFRDGSTNLRLNIGMILDHQEIVDIDIAEMGEVSNSLKVFPARTDSLAVLQRSVAHTRRYERQHAERERWLRPPKPCASADQLTAAISPPMRLPLRTVPTGSSSNTGCSSRKPTNSVCRNSRLRF